MIIHKAQASYLVDYITHDALPSSLMIVHCFMCLWSTCYWLVWEETGFAGLHPDDSSQQQLADKGNDWAGWRPSQAQTHWLRTKTFSCAWCRLLSWTWKRFISNHLKSDHDHDRLRHIWPPEGSIDTTVAAAGWKRHFRSEVQQIGSVRTLTVIKVLVLKQGPLCGPCGLGLMLSGFALKGYSTFSLFDGFI